MLNIDLNSLPMPFLSVPDPECVRILAIKLRWIGLDSEAEALSDYLARNAPDLVLTAVADTD